MKILHISESFEGGVASAVANYVDLTSEHEHFLLCSKRSGRLDCGIMSKFSTVYNLTSGHFSAIKTVRKIVDKLQPDVIHCHSSFGGAYGRLAHSRRKCPALMIYSPHCYAFERRDISWFSRCGFYIMEWVMARRTDVVVACSQRERDLAKKLRRGAQAVFVPNLASVKSPNSSLPFAKRGDLVVMLGRLSPQKDPGWFAEVARVAATNGDDKGVEFVWVGDGGAEYRKQLEGIGVRVTGWLEAKEVAKILGRAKAYLHTAKWEGFPIALLDAAECGAAVVARKATYLEGVRGAQTVVSTEEAARTILEILEDEKKWAKNRKNWEIALEGNTALLAAKRLQDAYAVDKKA